MHMTLCRPQPEVGDRVLLGDINGRQIVTVEDVDYDGKNGRPVFIYTSSRTGVSHWAYLDDIRELR